MDKLCDLDGRPARRQAATAGHGQTANCHSLYHVGAYIRLSKENTAYDSDSVENQREMLSRFIAVMPGWVEARMYVDNGYGGGSFDRPAFQEMMADVRCGLINLVLVKDLSRFGRNYLESGRYLENELPALGCRFVSLSDGIDTETGENDIMPFLNAMNDYYLKNLSGRIKTVLAAKAADGQKISGAAPYGYDRSADGQNWLIVDEYAADVIRRIFDLRLQGMGYAKIAGVLNREKIMPPRLYYFTKRKWQPSSQCTALWNYATVKSLLRNEVYAGHSVQLVRGSVSHRDSRTVHRPKDEWVRVENTHTAIIGADTWRAVQAINESAGDRNRACVERQPPGLFAGLAVCADCKAKMLYQSTRRVRNDGTAVYYGTYSCAKYRSTGGGTCSWHSISEGALKTILREQIRRQTEQVALDEGAMLDALAKRLIGGDAVSKAEAEKERRALRQRLHALEALTANLYEDRLTGIISDESYTAMAGSIEAERAEKETRLALLEQTEQEAAAKLNDIQSWIRLIKEKSSFEDLDRELLDCLIERIEVSERAVVDGVKRQDVKVVYKFVGAM